MTLPLGYGCSGTALLDGKPVDKSMGFSPLEGLIMATRPGDLDAGVRLELERRGESWSTIGHMLNREAGLKGLSGATVDVVAIVEESLIVERVRDSLPVTTPVSETAARSAS